MTQDPNNGAPMPKVKPNTEGKKIVNMKCRNAKCESITAIDTPIPGNRQRLYVCTECGHPVSLNVGGSFDI